MADRERPHARAACVRVVYALPDRHESVDVALEPGMNVQTAVDRSGLLQRFPQPGSAPLACAIFGQPAALTQQLRAGDRIEILRPLVIDPKEGRRQAARAQQQPRRR
jgi:putative ubiquitin-RnfH superfamily antitoxin RatB of RatAB toxin-antitoxin module